MNKVKLVVIHKNGNVVYFEDGKIAKNISLEEIKDDAIVLDISEVIDTKDGVNMMMCSPTVDVRLKDGEIYYAPSVSNQVLDALLSFEQKLQSLHLKMKEYGIAGPLDIISAEQYVRNWQSIGAKVGKLLNGQIDWGLNND